MKNKPSNKDEDKNKIGKDADRDKRDKNEKFENKDKAPKDKNSDKAVKGKSVKDLNTDKDDKGKSDNDKDKNKNKNKNKNKKDRPKNIHADHHQRLRRRFIKEGLDGFEDHEKLEFALHYPIKRRDTNGIAHALLSRFTTLTAVLDASAEELREVDDVGRGASLFLKLIHSVGVRYANDRFQDVNLELNEDIVDCVGMRCVAEAPEVGDDFYSVVLLGDSSTVVASVRLPDGGMWKCKEYIDTGTIAKLLFKYKCKKFILVRNVADGCVYPSKEDECFASTVASTFASMSRSMVEYILVSKTGYHPVFRCLSKQREKRDENQKRKRSAGEG